MLWEPRREPGRQVSNLSNRIARMQAEGWDIKVFDLGDRFNVLGDDGVKIKKFKYNPRDPRGISKIDARKEVIDFLKLLEGTAPARQNGYWPTEIHIDEIAVMEEEEWQWEEEETPGQRAMRELTRRKLEDPMKTLSEAFEPLEDPWADADVISEYGFVNADLLFANDPTVINAATEAVAALTSRWEVVDSAGKVSWLQIGPDGGPTEEAARLIAEALRQGKRPWWKRWWKRKRKD